MRKILAFFILLTSFFIGAALADVPNGAAIPQGDFSALQKAGSAKVLQVIDPLTLQLDNGKIVQLSALDFPDYDQYEPGEFSVLAVKILKDMLVGQRVNLYQTPQNNWGRMNRMGHYLFHVERAEGKAWVQGALISLGLARVRTTQRNPEMAAQLYTLEKQARHSKTGLWALEDYQVLSPDDAIGHLNSFQIVEGMIKSTGLKNNRIFLNFGSDWREDFTVSIAPEDKRLFSQDGLQPLDLRNQHIRVRGWLRFYNGPFMEINHPQAIEIIAAEKDNALPEMP